MSAAWAWNDFLQTSRGLPASFFMPLMPSAQVLQVLRERMRRKNSSGSPDSRALRNEYRMACKPPPLFMRASDPGTRRDQSSPPDRGGQRNLASRAPSPTRRIPDAAVAEPHLPCYPAASEG